MLSCAIKHPGHRAQLDFQHSCYGAAALESQRSLRPDFKLTPSRPFAVGARSTTNAAGGGRPPSVARCPAAQSLKCGGSPRQRSSRALPNWRRRDVARRRKSETAPEGARGFEGARSVGLWRTSVATRPDRSRPDRVSANPKRTEARFPRPLRRRREVGNARDDRGATSRELHRPIAARSWAAERRFIGRGAIRTVASWT